MEIYEMGELLLGIGGLVFLITLVGLIVALIRKKKRRTWASVFFGGLALIVSGGVMQNYKTEKAVRRIETRKEIKMLEREMSSLKSTEKQIKKRRSEIKEILALIGEAKQIEFRVLDADAEFLKGTPVAYKGKIVQIEKGSNTTNIRLRVGEGADDIIYLEDNDVVKEIYKDDIITIGGIVRGFKRYKSIAGWKITLPLIDVKVLSKNGLAEEKRKLTQKMEELESQEVDVKKQILNYEKEINDKEGIKEGEKTSQTFSFKPKEHEQIEGTKEGDSWYPEQVLDEGIKKYTEAIELGVGGDEIYYNRGLFYLHKKEFDKAIADFTEVRDKLPYAEEALQQAKKMKKLVETGENQPGE